MKPTEIQRPPVRAPRQERAKQKVELILEAAMRLLDKGGMPTLTTNAVAATAGVSIGSLYQYFPNKEAILDALAEHELAGLSERVLAAIRDSAEVSAQERVSRIVRAVTASYGDRRRVHRLALEYSLSRGGKRMTPLIGQIVALLASPDRSAPVEPMSKAEAFVLTSAFVGVMRAMIMRSDESGPSQEEIEAALGRLMTAL